MTLKIVSWNVNSIKVRLDHVKQYLEQEKPDVLMMQELKGIDFPADDFKALGYEAQAVGQKAYNGVAVLSKKDIKLIHTALPGDEADEQARYLEFEIDGLRLINIYLPNGNPYPSEKYDYKLAWMNRLYSRLKNLRTEGVPFAIGGDFNVIPEDKDCHDPKAWKDDALFRIETRRAFRKILHLGLTDAFRIDNSAGGEYTFWDYQGGAWEKGAGIRIDHFLLSPEITDRLETCHINIEPRGWTKPSDHTPIMIEVEK